jgi:putative DNA primase/helicase
MDVGPIGWGHDNNFWTYADGVWSPEHLVVQHRVVDLLGDKYRRTHTTNTADVVQRHAQVITADPLKELMNFSNVMLEWRTGKTFDHDPSYGSTVQFGCEWDPEATCERFDEWLADTLHPDYVDLAWEMIGYLMLSGNPKHHAFLLYGIGGSGKSTLLKVITLLLQERNIASETLDALNSNRFRTASLYGRIANIAGDIDSSYQENTATFKRITGQDSVSAEHKGTAPFKFVNWAVPVFSANEIPGSSDVTEGYLRRWIILRFKKKVPDDKKIDDFDQFLARELPGIAVKGVEALRTLMARGDGGYFDPQGEAIEGQDEFAMTIDQVRQWHASAGVMAAPESMTNLQEIFDHYSAWATRSNQHKLRESKFSLRLTELGYHTERIGGEVFHKGISVPTRKPAVITPGTYFTEKD